MLDVEQAFGEALFKGGGVSAVAGMGAENGPKSVPVVTYWSLVKIAILANLA